ncbi:MAG: hypothetical protein HOP35_12310 [Nitrospira sp.]|nr:hypothetical protein [Nitrospira sp.]
MRPRCRTMKRWLPDTSPSGQKVVPSLIVLLIAFSFAGSLLAGLASATTIVKTKLADGSIVSQLPGGASTTKKPNGTVITRLPEGVTFTVYPDGTTFTQLPGGGTITTAPRKERVRRRLPDGTKISLGNDGLNHISFPTTGRLTEGKEGITPITTIVQPGGTTTVVTSFGDSHTTLPDRTEIYTGSLGHSTTIFPSGVSISTLDPNQGNPNLGNKAAEIGFPDKTRIRIDPDGTITVTTPDGRQQVYRPTDISPSNPPPSLNVAPLQNPRPPTGSIILPGPSTPGTTLSKPSPGTTMGMPQAGGTSITPGIQQTPVAPGAGASSVQVRQDGTRIERLSDGTVITTYPEGTKVTTYPDGRSGVQAPPGGASKEIGGLPDGGTYIVMRDGTRIEHHSDGTTVTTYPEGTKVTTYPDGRSGAQAPPGGASKEVGGLPDGGTYIVMRDGTRIEHHSDGTTVTTYPEGTKVTTRRDGTTITDDPKTGIRTVKEPNGSTSTSPLLQAKPSSPPVNPSTAAPPLALNSPALQQTRPSTGTVQNIPIGPQNTLNIPVAPGSAAKIQPSFQSSNFQFNLGSLPATNVAKVELPKLTPKVSTPSFSPQQRALGVIPRAVEAESSRPSSSPTLELYDVIEFISVDGATMTVPPGTYQVEEVDESIQITSVDVPDLATYHLEGQPAVYEGAIPGPGILWLPDEETEHQVLLLLGQDGDAMYTIGTNVTIQARAIKSEMSPNTFLFPGGEGYRLVLPSAGQKRHRQAAKLPLRVTRCTTPPAPLGTGPAQLPDSGRSSDDECRDMNPGALQVILGNMLGISSQAVVEDRATDPQRSFGVVPRGVDKMGGNPSDETVDTNSKMEKKP